MAINGIKAAWLEKNGLGSFALNGRKITFTGRDRVSVSWTLPTPQVARIQLKLFRAATKYPETEAA